MGIDLFTLAQKACRLALVAGLALAASACKSRGGGSGALSRAEPEGNAFADVPVPPADGPRLVALADATPVMDRPSLEGKLLGELRAGSAVARSREAYSSKGCEGGWYAVRPRGFVCAGASVALDAATARGVPAGPALERALPYRYARARVEGVPVYARVPTAAEQLAIEPDLARRGGAREADSSPLGAAANDVPLDDRGVATGPPVLLPTSEGMEGGKRTALSYFAFPTEAVAPALSGGEVKVGMLRKGSGIALTGSFVAGGTEGAGGRRFGVTLDGRLVPTDRLKPALGATFHGLELDKMGLPVAFIHKLGVHPFSLHRGKAVKRDDELERRAAVALSGRFRTVDGVRFEETREGAWLRAQDLMIIVKRHKLPEFASGTQKWLDVSIANQTLTAYEGTKPVFATLISSGRDQMKDPQTTASTARGIFRVLSKHVTRARDGREGGGGFDVADAPWVIEFEPGFALTGMYWGDGVGEARGFHDIALSPIDAHRLFTWADPPLPEGWHGVYEVTGQGTTFVNVRP